MSKKTKPVKKLTDEELKIPIIAIEGGVLLDCANMPNGYILVDWDNLKGGDKISKEDAEICYQSGFINRGELDEHIEE